MNLNDIIHYMNYKIVINDNPILSGNVFTLFLVGLIILFIIAYIARVIFNKIKLYETMKYEFITIIAHKFRTPLTQIKWIVEASLPGETDSFKKESLDSINKSTETLIGLTNTLVEITDSANKVLAVYSFEKLNICEIISKITGSLKDRFHEKNIFFGITCAETEIFVKGDKARLEFVLQTVIENTINYSPVGSNVEVTISKEKSKVVIYVIDQGIGIKAEDLPHIFTKFFRTSNAQAMDTEGFGVGLFLAKSVVKRHNGEINVFSKGVGKGSTFSISLPLAK